MTAERRVMRGDGHNPVTRKENIMKYEEMNYTEQRKFAAMLWSWLKGYTDEVINRVLAQKDDILSNEVAMFMLEELYLRKQKEQDNHERDLVSALDCGRPFERFTTLTHAGSYGDVLADMYIRPEWQYSRKESNNESKG